MCPLLETAAKVIEAVDGWIWRSRRRKPGRINVNLNLALQDDTRAEIVPEDFIEEKAGMAHLNGNQTVASRIRVLGGDALGRGGSKCWRLCCRRYGAAG